MAYVFGDMHTLYRFNICSRCAMVLLFVAQVGHLLCTLLHPRPRVCTDMSSILGGKIDVYGGVIVDVNSLPSNRDEFDEVLGGL